MDKVKITVAQKEPVSFRFFGQGEVFVKPFLSLEDKLKLSEAYLSAIFENDDNKYSLAMHEIEAEYTIVIGIVDLCTNLSIDFGEDKNAIDNVVGSGLWFEIRKRIENYDEFRKDLDALVLHKKENIIIEKSLGTTFDRMANAVIDLMDKMSKMDISDAGVQKAMKSLQEGINKIQADNVIAPASKARKKRVSKKDLVQ